MNAPNDYLHSGVGGFVCPVPSHLQDGPFRLKSYFLKFHSLDMPLRCLWRRATCPAFRLPAPFTSNRERYGYAYRYMLRKWKAVLPWPTVIIRLTRNPFPLLPCRARVRYIAQLRRSTLHPMLDNPERKAEELGFVKMNTKPDHSRSPELPRSDRHNVRRMTRQRAVRLDVPGDPARCRFLMLASGRACSAIEPIPRLSRFAGYPQ